MSKTNYLRALVQSKLVAICSDTFYHIATAEPPNPHIVWNISNVDISDEAGLDLVRIDIDLWYRGDNYAILEDMADEVEAAFRDVNDPQENILPTFFGTTRSEIEDTTDRSLNHILIKVECQTYERS